MASPPLSGFQVDIVGYQLLDNGRRVRLERQPMELLILLAFELVQDGMYYVTRPDALRCNTSVESPFVAIMLQASSAARTAV